jgi:hypothetical protein
MKNTARELFPFIPLVLIVILGVIAGHFIAANDIIVGGILGSATIYFMSRSYLNHSITRDHSDNKFLHFTVRNIIFCFLIGLLSYLAFHQFFKMILWLIKIL